MSKTDEKVSTEQEKPSLIGGVRCSTSLHDLILYKILAFKVIFKEVERDVFLDWIENCTVDYDNNKLEIQICKDTINWIKEGKLNFASRCFLDVESIVKGFNINGDYIDSYGSVLVKNELLLNNYDCVLTENNKSEKGFCDVIGFATINNKGDVRFTQIVYSFLFKKLIIRDDVKYKLPFKPKLKTDFGGKRAMYRRGSILSLRTNISVYKKVDKKHWQSDRRKNDLSYPRLLLF